MATTPNYGWVTPAPTDLVTDLPADFEIFADAVDADLAGLLGGTTGQVLKKTSNLDHAFAFGTDPTTDVVTTAGDLIYGTGADAVTRLGIGTAGQVLAVNSGATAPEWIAAPGGYSPNLVLINTGGTTLTGSSTSITGLSGYSTYLVDLNAVGSTNATCEFKLRINNDTANNYIRTGNRQDANSSYSAAIFSADGDSADNGIQLGYSASNASSRLSGSVLIFGGDIAARSIYIQHTGMTNAGGSTGQVTINRLATHNRAAAITSMQIVASTGTLVGTVKIYGA